MVQVTYFSYKTTDPVAINVESTAGTIVEINLNPIGPNWDPDKLKYFYLEDGREYSGPKWVWNLGFELSTQKVPLWFPINGDMHCAAVKWQISQSATAREHLMV